MHINYKSIKRQKRRAAAAIKLETIRDTTFEPDYLKITGYKEKAAALGLTICEDTKAGKYHIQGAYLDSINEDKQIYSSLLELKAAINEFWEIATEPELESYFDSSGQCHERLIYPESLIL